LQDIQWWLQTSRTMRMLYCEGDQALITSGPLAGKVGTITKIDEPQQTVTLVLNIFERETIVEVAFMRLLPRESTETAVSEQ